MTFFIHRQTLPLSEVEMLLLRKAISLTLVEKSLDDIFRKLVWSKSRVERDHSLFNIDMRVKRDMMQVSMTNHKGEELFTIKMEGAKS